MKKKTSIISSISFVVLSIVAVIFVFPFYWVITGAFKHQASTVQASPQWFPIDPTLANWVKLFKNPAMQWLYNSFFISFMTMLLVCLTASLAGYVLAKKKFIGKDLIFACFIGAMALPKQVILVPLVRLINQWGFHNTPWAVILPAVGFPFGIFLMKQFSETLPTELLESSKIDGCSELGTFARILSGRQGAI